MLFLRLKCDYYPLNYDKSDVNFVEIWLVFEDLSQNNVYMVKI